MLINDGSSSDSDFDCLMQHRHQLWYLIQGQRGIDLWVFSTFNIDIFILEFSPDYAVSRFKNLIFIQSWKRILNFYLKREIIS